MIPPNKLSNITQESNEKIVEAPSISIQEKAEV
jgi:2-keto-4-pentenoate hydratase